MDQVKNAFKNSLVKLGDENKKLILKVYKESPIFRKRHKYAGAYNYTDMKSTVDSALQ